MSPDWKERQSEALAAATLEIQIRYSHGRFYGPPKPEKSLMGPKNTKSGYAAVSRNSWGYPIYERPVSSGAGYKLW